VAGVTTADVLQERLTEHGLVRTLARQDISPELVQRLSVDEAARLLERGMLYPGSTHKTAKKAKKAKMATGARYGGGRAKKATVIRKRVKKSAKRAAEKSTPKSASKSRIGTAHQPRPRFWKRVNREVRILVCTDDKKYENLRTQIGKQRRVTQFSLVSSITTAIGIYLGVAASLIAPFVTLALMALLQVGKNAWCAGQTT